VSARSAARSPDRGRVTIASMLRIAATAPIVVYQRFVSPALPRRCKYEPTCSRYAVEAIRRFGVTRGIVLAAWRLLRCNPWSYGGYDPVEAQHVFGRSEHACEPRRGRRVRAARAGSGQGPSCSPPNPV
jgi:uncharacterized protein